VAERQCEIDISRIRASGSKFAPLYCQVLQLPALCCVAPLSGWSAAATFEGEFSSVTTSYAGKGVMRYSW
jgi:hypothetical protein